VCSSDLWDFLVLRAASGEVPQELPDWWADFLDASHEEREQMLLPDTDKKRKRRSRGRGRKAGEEKVSGGDTP
jgi:poly(A) polymerase